MICYGISGYSKLPENVDPNKLLDIVSRILSVHKGNMSLLITGTGTVPDWAHKWAEQNQVPHITLVPEVYAKYADEPFHQPVQVEGKERGGEIPYYLQRIDVLLTFGGGAQTETEKSLAAQYNVRVLEVDISAAVLETVSK